MRGRLCEERLRSGLALEDAAREMGIPAALLESLESGVREVCGSQLVSMSRLYDCSPDYLLGLSDDRHAGLVKE